MNATAAEHAYVAARAHAEVLELLAADPASPPPAYAEVVRTELAGFAAESDYVAGAVLGEAPRLAALAAELLEAARLTVGPIFAGPAPASEAEARASLPTSAGPALRWDAELADALDALGGVGRERAAAIRSAAAERFANPDVLPANLWRLWRSEAGNAPRWLRNLARALWKDRWRPAIERARQDRKASARDAVNHPDHYGGADNPYEAIKVIEAWDLNFNLGNVVKHIALAGKKQKNTLIGDLEKARQYLDFEIERRVRQQERR